MDCSAGGERKKSDVRSQISDVSITVYPSYGVLTSAILHHTSHIPPKWLTSYNGNMTFPQATQDSRLWNAMIWVLRISVASACLGTWDWLVRWQETPLLHWMIDPRDVGGLDWQESTALAIQQVVGWAALAPVSDRCVYGGVAEVSIYIAAAARGRGLGHALLPALVSASEDEGLWTLQAGIFPENEASIALHRKHGFRVVGVREKLGEMNGKWRDVVLLERRSARVGV